MDSRFSVVLAEDPVTVHPKASFPASTIGTSAVLFPSFLRMRY
jgi:hypothetical protein